MTGWEGTATDALLWQDTSQKGLIIPNGKYLLGDAGFPTTPKLLTPYKGVQYHPVEWEHAELRSFLFIFEFNLLINFN